MKAGWFWFWITIAILNAIFAVDGRWWNMCGAIGAAMAAGMALAEDRND